MNNFRSSGALALTNSGRVEAKGDVAGPEQHTQIATLLLGSQSCNSNTVGAGRGTLQLHDTLGTSGRFVSAGEAAIFLGVSRSTFFRFRRNDPTFPKPAQFSSGVVRFRLADLITWAESKASR